MGRLRALGSGLKVQAPRVTTRRDAEGHGPSETGRSWYSLKAWEDLRQRVFLRDGYTCQCGCGELITNPAERIADHVREHRGDRRLFFDIDNVQTLWKPHHDGWKQRLERRRQGGGG